MPSVFHAHSHLHHRHYIILAIEIMIKKNMGRAAFECVLDGSTGKAAWEARRQHNTELGYQLSIPLQHYKALHFVHRAYLWLPIIVRKRGDKFSWEKWRAYFLQMEPERVSTRRNLDFKYSNCIFNIQSKCTCGVEYILFIKSLLQSLAHTAPSWGRTPVIYSKYLSGYLMSLYWLPSNCVEVRCLVLFACR